MKILSKLTFLALLAILFFSGCKKDSVVQSVSSGTTKNVSYSTSVPDGYTMTSVGLIPDSNVTLIEDGYKISFMNGHAYKLHIASGKLVRDLGKIMPNTASTRVASNSINPRVESLSRLMDAAIFGSTSQGWVTYAQWQNQSTSNPITNFTSNFTVPMWPTSQSNKIFSIWMGLEPAADEYPLIQPLLIWGNSGGQIGGGQSWTLVSYVIWISEIYDGQPVYSAGISTPVYNISPETALQAKISYTGQQPDGSYNYTSQFVGYTSLNITEGAQLTSNSGGTVEAPTIPALNYACEVLEIPSSYPNPTTPITSVYQYPAQFDESMTSSITTGIGSNATNPTISWQSGSITAGLGEQTLVSSSSLVNIYFQPPPTGTFPVTISTNDTQSIFFNLSINGSPPQGAYRIGQGQFSTTANVLCDELSNSTVIMTIVEAGGIMPSGATLYNLGAPIQGVISGSTITFSNVNLTAGTSCQIVAD